ncbi:MAG: cellulose biosynthesis protein BcsE [Vibrio sp.]
MFGIHRLPQKHTAFNAAGIYITTLANQRLASDYLRPLLKLNEKCKFISFQSIPEFFEPLDTTDKETFKAYFYKKNVYFLAHNKRKNSADKLIEDIKKINLFSGDKVVLNIPDHIILTLRESQQAKFFAYLNRIASQKRIQFFIILQGQESYNVNHWCMANPQYFLGLSSLHQVDAQLFTYQVHYWIADGVISNAQDYDVLKNEDNEFVIDVHELEELNENLQHQTFLYDLEFAYVSQGVIDVNHNISDESVLFFENNDDLFANIKNVNHGMVVLSVHQQSEVHNIAVQCYRLRRRFGNEFKIVLREMQQCLRYSDETFLSFAGLNLIIPASVNFARFLSITENLQKQKVLCKVPDSIDELLNQESTSQFGLKGYVNNNRFVGRCHELVEKYQTTNLQFALVKLSMIPGVDMHACLSMCHIKRDGDLVTACHDAVYLLLSSVRENDVYTALAHIFELPIGDMFQSHTIFTTMGRITQVLPDIVFQAMDIDVEKTHQVVSEAQLQEQTNDEIAFAKAKPLQFKM